MAALVRWDWQTTDVMAPSGVANVVEVPRRLPAGPDAFPVVVRGVVEPCMALSLQSKAFTPVLHDVRPEPRTDGPSLGIARVGATSIGWPPETGR